MRNMPIMSLAILVGFVSVSYGDSLGFLATLSGAQEVPGVVTDTIGKCKVKFNREFSEAQFRLDVGKGMGVTQAHLHCAPAGVNGPVVAFLFPLSTGGVDANGKLATGVLTNADIIPTTDNAECGLPEINNIASLAAAMLDGRIYCNVHTLVNPAGEVRGQILE
ncbi:MAG: CHRD domain-containing protein [Candidatus Binatia bacterium]